MSAHRGKSGWVLVGALLLLLLLNYHLVDRQEAIWHYFWSGTKTIPGMGQVRLWDLIRCLIGVVVFHSPPWPAFSGSFEERHFTSGPGG